MKLFVSSSFFKDGKHFIALTPAVAFNFHGLNLNSWSLAFFLKGKVCCSLKRSIVDWFWHKRDADLMHMLVASDAFRKFSFSGLPLTSRPKEQHSHTPLANLENISRVRNSRKICSANLWHFGAHAIMSEKLLYIQKLICHLFHVSECLKSFMKAGKRLSSLQAHLCSPTHTRKQFICSGKSGKPFLFESVTISI